MASKLTYVLLLVSLAVASSTVLRFRQRLREEHPEIAEVLLEDMEGERYLPLEYFENLKMNSAFRLKAFSWKNCGDPSNEMAALNSLSVSPDPIPLPGSINIGFNVVIKDNVDSPVKMVVQIKKKVADTWITIPCVDSFGSCTYDDFCQILANIQECPDPFISAGVPCQCPFNKGNYTLPKSDFDVDISILPSGDYQGQADLSINGKPVGCYQVTLTFA